MMNLGSKRTRLTRQSRFTGFTLVELLVVLFLLLLLAAIALPNVKKILSDQLVSRTARSVTAYIDVARSRAISEGRQVGFLIERAGPFDDARGRAHSIRLRQLTDVPPYSGDASNAFAVLRINGTQAQFDPIDNQLLALSASMVRDPGVSGDLDDPQAPIRNGDTIEFPGGRIVPFRIVFRALTEPDNVPVVINFDVNEPYQWGSAATQVTELFPSANKPITAVGSSVGRPVKYKIHRRPVVSTVAPLDLPRGIAFDLNYSGFGISGNQFAPDDDVSIPVFNVQIVFGPDGKVVSVTEPVSGSLLPPTGQIFLCLGDSDGIRPDNLFSRENKATANLLNLKSGWIVINAATGRATSAPFSSVSTIPAAVVTDTAALTLGPAIAEARFLANLSDTVDQE